MELSLCMIVRDEEKNLERCLQSVREAVDEIIILDTGSTDQTKKIAAKYTTHVDDYAWQDDFSAARNASLALATKPFILWLDADDVIEAPQLEKLIALKGQLHDGIDAVMMPYHYAFSQDGTPSLVFDRERIVRREAGFALAGAVHEAISVSGSVIRENIVIRHTGEHGADSNARNLRIYAAQMVRGERLSPRDQYYYARELKSAGRLEQAEQAFAAFLSEVGWQVNRLDAQIQRAECLLHMGRLKEAKQACLSALECGAPHAEALCVLGACFLEEDDLQAAEHWYRAALLCRMPQDKRSFVSPQAYGYIPLMQLCVILSRLGDDVQASRMNEQALLLQPGDPAALYNRAYFTEKLKKDRQNQEKPGWEE